MKTPPSPGWSASASAARRKQRRLQILDAGFELARTKPYGAITRAELARVTGLSDGSVSVQFGTMSQFRRELMRAAVTQRITHVVAQGLAVNDRFAERADAPLRAACAAHLRG